MAALAEAVASAEAAAVAAALPAVGNWTALRVVRNAVFSCLFCVYLYSDALRHIFFTCPKSKSQI